MRIYALSNVKGGLERIVAALNNADASTMAREEVGADVKELGKLASEAITHGNYDAVILVPEDYIKACIVLNKFEGVNAALCNSVEETELAEENDVNVIILKPSEHNLGYITEWLMKRTRKEGERVSDEGHGKEHEEKRHEGGGHGHEDKEKKEDEHRHGAGSGAGLFGGLKDALGILDKEER